MAESTVTTLAVVSAAWPPLVMATMLWAPQAVLLLEPLLMFQRVAMAKSMVTWTPHAVLLLVRSSLAVMALI